MLEISQSKSISFCDEIEIHKSSRIVQGPKLVAKPELNLVLILLQHYFYNITVKIYFLDPVGNATLAESLIQRPQLKNCPSPALNPMFMYY